MLAPQQIGAELELAKQYAIFPIHSPKPDGACSCGKVPCTSIGKHPRTRNGLKDSTRDRAIISRWAREFPGCNWAIDTGASQLVVIDIDPKSGGDESWLKLCCAHDAVPATRTVLTGSGGKHYYFKAPYNIAVKSSAGKLGKGLDVRAKGGYVVAPPSLHASGKRYTWEHDGALADLPAWLLTLLGQTPAGAPAKPKRETTCAPTVDGWLAVALGHDGLLGRDLGDRYELFCPWSYEHTCPQDEPDSSTVVFKPLPGHTLGHFHCSHAHCSGRTIDDVKGVLTASAIVVADTAYPLRSTMTEPHPSDLAYCPPDDEDHPLPADPDAPKIAPVVDIKTREWLPQPDDLPTLDDPEANTLAGSTPDVTTEGKLLPTAHNALIILAGEEWKSVLAWDEMAGKAVYLRQPPLPRWMHMEKISPFYPLRDRDYRLLKQYFASTHSIRLSTESAREAVDTQSEMLAVHPIRTHLLECLEAWDGTPRLSTGAVVYLHAQNEPQMSNEFFRRWMISAVARVFEPGCKADHVLVLEGEQGCGKSRFFSTLGTLPGGREYSTSMISDLSNKDARAALHQSAWIVVMSELESMLRTSPQAIKDFITRTTDRYRPAYGRVEIANKRSCIFGADTNERGWLRDDTGGRRLWPIRCGTIDHERTLQDVTHLWGEAMSQYQDGEPWHLDTVGLTARAAAIQADRRDADPWAGIVETWLRSRMNDTISMDAIFDGPLDMKPAQIGRREQMRLASILRSVGFQSGVVRTGSGLSRRWAVPSLLGENPGSL